MTSTTSSTRTEITFRSLHIEMFIPGEPGATAAAIIARLRLKGEARDVLADLILEKCTDLDRVRVRYIERGVGRVSTESDDFGNYLEETFAVGDGKRVRWDEATVDDHRARIAFLAQMRDGIDLTIAKHQKAIETILANGVTCLGDLTVTA